MSCLRRRRFKNPIKDENRTGYDKFTITGNCCQCAGCNKRKQNDWLVRSYFEYLSKPHDVFFVTLDFADYYLPRYKDIPCFDSKLLSDWFNNFRHYVPDFRFLYSSHFGEALNRPHYHVAFLFDKGAISEDDFTSILNEKWYFGSHTDISLLKSVKRDPLAAFEYICKYATRNTKFLARAAEVNMPKRFRPLTNASIGFGAQCMDPGEINSERLFKEGIKFLDRPIITRDYILNNSQIYLDLKRDGVLVPFAIPRYYELKLCFDRSYNPEDKKTTLTKNDVGKQLQINRHNADYVKLYKDFVNSRYQPLHKDLYTSSIYHEVFPDSPYNGVAWHDVVDDVLLDRQSFFEFCKYYKYLEFDLSLPGYMRYRPLKFIGSSPLPLKKIGKPVHTKDFKLKGYTVHSAPLDGSLDDIYNEDIDLYIYAMSYYQIWLDVERYRQAEYEDWRAFEQTKLKIKEKCKNDLGYYWHLRRKNFKFYKLNSQSYVSRYQIREN